MTFLHPWAIGLGAAALALPVLIHWLTRPRPVRLPLSTVRFVREAIRQRRARHRLRDVLVLALRTLAVLLLAWAVARPLAGTPPPAEAGAGGVASRVVLLDVSQSMGAAANGIQLLERARPVAAGCLGDEPGLEANLVLAGAGGRPVFERFSTNFTALRQELAQARVRPERLNVLNALSRAAELLAAAGNDPGRRRELVIVSDFQRSNWAAVDFSILPADTSIRLESVAPPAPLTNLAVLRVGCPGRVELGREARLEVEVGNFSPAPRKVQVEVVLGEATYRLEGLCQPGDRTTLSVGVTPRGAGWQAGEARLVGVQDALPADDVRPFVLEVRPAPTYALLTRQAADVYPSSSYYLERALVPSEPRPGRQEARVLRLDLAQLDREALAAAEVLVLDHPGRLGDDAIKLLAALLRRGRGLLYVAAEPADALNLKRLADAAGADLQLPVAFAPAPADQPRRNLFLTEVRGDQVPFRVFGDGLARLVGTLRFSGGLASRRLEGALADDVLASYSDRSACLVVSACGAGTLAVLNADLGASNLPASPAFVPLVGELTGRLLGTQRGGEPVACGEPAVVHVPASAGPVAGLRVLGPGPAVEAGTLAEEGGGVVWRSPAAGPPGVYRVQRGDRVVLALASAVPPEESDLRGMDPALLQGRLAGGRAVSYHDTAAGEERRDDLWVWLAGGCVACLLTELGVLKLFQT